MHLGSQENLEGQIMHKHVEGTMNRTWINCVLSLLIAIVIAGCGGGSAQPQAPGEIERLSNATIYHLKNGVFIHEAFEGADHYYLLHDLVESYEITRTITDTQARTRHQRNQGTMK